MLGLILLVFASACLAPLVSRLTGRHAGWFLAAVPAWVLWVFGGLLPLGYGPAWVESAEWVPSLGITLSFLADGLSVVFVMLICGIGAVVLIYAGGYMAGDARAGRLLAFLLLFMGSMLGVVLADDVITLFVFWELTSVSSFLLIGFKHTDKKSRESALMALVVTGGGGLCLLAGLVLLQIAVSGEIGASFRLSDMLQADPRGSRLYLGALLLILAGAFTKSAQVPFHFWLPAAMAAPSPVSAYLHSATMVKAGVYLLYRLHPMLGGTAEWTWLVTGFGAATMVTGAVLTAGHSDLKRILAYSTVSVLGTLVMLIGMGHELALKAAVVYLVAHACYKAALFLAAGSVDHETGTRDVRALGGLWGLMPVTGLAVVLAMISMVGAPPMLGFIGKELLFKAAKDGTAVGTVLLGVSMVAGVFVVAAGLSVFKPFVGARTASAEGTHEAPVSMLFGPVVLALLGLGLGLFPGLFELAVGSAMAGSLAGREMVLHLKLVDWSQWVVLILSGVTLAAGALAFGWLHRRRDHWERLLLRVEGVSPTRVYQRLLYGLFDFASWHMRWMQHGYLRVYVGTIVLIVVGLVVWPLWELRGVFAVTGLLDVAFHEIVLCVIIGGGGVYAAVSRSRLAAIVSLGATGLGVSMLFAFYGAPDLAVTQLMVEALTVIIFVLVFYHLPSLVERRPVQRRLNDMAIACVAGASMTLLILASAGMMLPNNASSYYLAESVSLANGRNIVNVILVDFRALDTLGEVTVVLIAGLGVWALLGLRPRAQRDRVAPVNEGEPMVAAVEQAPEADQMDPAAQSGGGHPCIR